LTVHEIQFTNSSASGMKVCGARAGEKQFHDAVAIWRSASRVARQRTERSSSVSH